MLCSAMFINCSEDERYKTLTFFFDGVPPFGQEGLENEKINADFRAAARTSSGPLWYVHEPRKDCTLCHDKSRQSAVYPQTYLKAPVPQLCYNCHSDYTVSHQYVHGPVAVGQCLFCHNPHASRVEHLLTEPQPQLCYKCHDQYAVELIPGHFAKQMSMCTNCHDAHAGSSKALLKVEPDRMGDIFNNTKTAGSSVQDIAVPMDKQTVTTPESSKENKNLLQVFSDVSKLIEKGDLQKARLYLFQYKDSKSFNDQERGKIAEALKLIDDALAQSKQSRSENYNSKLKQGGNQSPSKVEEIAELYYLSIKLYRAGEFNKAREGFIGVINSGLIPPEMEKTIRGYLSDIENKLSNQAK